MTTNNKNEIIIIGIITRNNLALAHMFKMQNENSLYTYIASIIFFPVKTKIIRISFIYSKPMIVYFRLCVAGLFILTVFILGH